MLYDNTLNPECSACSCFVSALPLTTTQKKYLTYSIIYTTATFNTTPQSALANSHHKLTVTGAGAHGEYGQTVSTL
jgi:hypothetical protein